MSAHLGPKVRNRREISRQVAVRVVPALSGVVWIGLGLSVRAAFTAPEVRFWSKYGGVLLWCWVVHACVRVVNPRLGILAAAGWTLAIGVGIEVAQLSGVPRWLSGLHWTLRLVFGEVFSVWDVAACVVAAGLVIPIDWMIRRLTPASMR